MAREWFSDPVTRGVWLTLHELADGAGRVEALALRARLAGVPGEACALEDLVEARRVARVEGGWQLVGYDRQARRD